MTIVISAGQEFERRRPDGTLEPLTIEEMAKHAYKFEGRLFCPQQTWEKQYDGQVTAGRIGRPVIRYCLVSWLPSAEGDQVKRIYEEG